MARLKDFGSIRTARQVTLPVAIATVAALAATAIADARLEQASATQERVANTTAVTEADNNHDHASHRHDDGRSHGKGIPSKAGNTKPTAFDLVRTTVRRQGDRLIFTEQVRGRAGSVIPEPSGQFAGSSVLSYVWPVSVNPSAVGFSKDSGVLALAATSHPDFDDTPLVDEDHNGRTDDDGRLWHAHWVVLVPDTTRPDGALKVRDIAPGEKPDLPKTWPGVPLYLDSPSYPTRLTGASVKIEVPADELGFPSSFSYDGVTAALKVNADLHDPLLRVENVFDVASGDLSLPGKFTW
ncbi:hypothetical protein ACTMSW_26150 [Micromonospora sp. BQ11]|uniref:hypothetical protein n=1 Tax=Micromonospora sp. BQ11 TaxID=3452212 RepID=UPI003F8A8581